MVMGIKERLVRFRSFWIFPALGVLLLYFTSRREPPGRFNDLFWLVPAGMPPGEDCLRDECSAAVDPRAAQPFRMVRVRTHLNAYPGGNNCQELNRLPAHVKTALDNNYRSRPPRPRRLLRFEHWNPSPDSDIRIVQRPCRAADSIRWSA